MSLSQPKAPDAGQTTGIQSQLNQNAAQEQQVLNEKNLHSFAGDTTYTNDGVYQSLSPQIQQLLSQFQGTQGQIGGTASKLASSIFSNPNYTGTPDFTSASAPLVQSQMDAFNKYMAPTYAMQQSNLDAKLQDQGLPQGGAAWNNAQRGQALSQDQAAQAALMQFEPQAYQQAVQSYELPLQSLAAMFGMTSPGSGTQGLQLPFTQQYTPQVNLQPANYMGAAQQQFQNQQNQFQNTMSGLGGVGSAVGGMFGLNSGGLGGLFGIGAGGGGSGGGGFVP